MFSSEIKLKNPFQKREGYPELGCIDFLSNFLSQDRSPVLLHRGNQGVSSDDMCVGHVSRPRRTSQWSGLWSQIKTCFFLWVPRDGGYYVGVGPTEWVSIHVTVFIVERF